MTTDTTSLTIAELREFASFTPGEQRYIKQSLDIGLGRHDAVKLWGRDAGERSAIRSQAAAYRELHVLRADVHEASGFDAIEGFLAKLIRITAHDLAQDRLTCFSAYRFLYERLLGAEVRPWLPSAFCAASALPQIQPDRRKTLLQSISQAAATAAGWSVREPSFYPEWVEKEAA